MNKEQPIRNSGGVLSTLPEMLQFPAMLFLLVLCLTGCKRKELAEAAGSAEAKFTFGTVIDVTSTNLRIKERDFGNNADLETAYIATPQTEFGNITSLTNLQPGDEVVVDYIETNHQFILTHILKEEPDTEEVTNPGRLVVPPDFQQIGDTEDGGGLLRAMAGTMSLLSTNPVEQERLGKLAREPNLPSRSEAETANLSGINKWIASTTDLPAAVELSQRSAFAPWKFLIWGDGSGESTAALYLTNELQFAWQGSSMFTTGPLLSEALGENPYVDFPGPPPGTDLDGDGVPDLLILDYSGGAHCCSTVKHIVCSNPPVLTAQISGSHCRPSYSDLDGDGRYEMTIGDASYAYWNACYAASPEPRVVFRILHGHYLMDADLMRSNAPAADTVGDDIKTLQHRLSRYDVMASRTNQTAKSTLTAEEEADDNFFFGDAWHPDDGSIRIPSPVWKLLLALVYSGQIDATINALNTIWPANKGHKAEFANDILAMIGNSWYGRHLPWFDELKKAFAQHYPPPSP